MRRPEALRLSAFSMCAAVVSFALTTTVARASCATVTACVFGQNTGAGFGLEGTAAANHGVYGATTYATTSSSTRKAGVYGRDLTSNPHAKYNSGVLGQSTYGFGVAGSSIANVGISGTSSSNYGVQGTSTANNGVAGKTTLNGSITQSASGVVGYDQSTNSNAYNSGVFGYSPYGVGVRGRSLNGNGIVGVSGDGTNGGQSFRSGVFGTSYDGVGVSASSTLGDAIVATTNVGYNYGTAAAIHAFALRNSFPPNPNIFIGSADNTGSMDDVVSIDTYGDMILAGSLTQNGTPLVRTAVAHGTAVMSYGARTSAPTIEDMGEARLVDGHASVRLDASFANTIDSDAKYLVMVTPQSDSKGLYVDHIGPAGFDVRENAAGHATLSFVYRISARPRDTASLRLPAADAFAHLGATRNAPKFVRSQALPGPS